MALEDGATYSGEVRNNKPHGYGTVTDKYGTTETGTFVNGVEMGRFVVEFYNGDRFEGECRAKDCRDAKGTYYFSDGSKFVGELKDGMKNGNGVQTWGEGSESAGARYEGEFNDNMKHGKGVYYFPNGDKYEGEYKNDKVHGNGVLTRGKQSQWAGDKYEGEWREGSRNGWGNYSYAKGPSKYFDGELIEDSFNGYGKLIYNDGSIYNGFWKISKEGDGLAYWPNGKIFFGRMKNNEMFQGIMMKPNMDVIFSPFKNGLANGNGYKISNSTGMMTCLTFVTGNEYSRPCHTYQVSQIYHDNFDFYEGEVTEQRRKQIKHGFGEFTGDDGTYIIGNWKENVQNGFGLQRLPWEPTRIGNFKNGVLEGAGVSISTTYTHKTMAIGDWSKGFMEGPGLFSYPNGDYVLGYFVKGRLDHEKNPIYVYSNGEISDTWFNVL